MNNELKSRADKFAADLKTAKEAFKWDSVDTQVSVACIYASTEAKASAESLKMCKDLIKKNTGLFSSFRGHVMSALCASISLNENPELLLNNTLTVYAQLKKHFFTSEYLPLASLIIARNSEPLRYEAVCERARKLYDLMKKEHPFLTNVEDCTMCALLALSDKTDAALINEMEIIYGELKHCFMSSDAVQGLSHVLALYGTDPASKIERVKAIYNALKQSGDKYSSDSGLPTLGVLAMCDAPVDKLVEEIDEVNKYLKDKPEFGLLSGISKQERIMYAGLLVAFDYIKDDIYSSAAITGNIASIIAESTCICACIAVTTAASCSTCQ